ncbi:hypothetical protein QVD17_02704 [Tagetes erecta]|uniref:Uncharacterized protein n=1 Tax=Tagetes erecta TaxID=13708 RepID=A0AAD8P2P2_TARER|nr:hypothetical protein QVD17_02704 [Tagetes erecta]
MFFLFLYNDIFCCLVVQFSLHYGYSIYCYEATKSTHVASTSSSNGSAYVNHGDGSCEVFFWFIVPTDAVSTFAFGCSVFCVLVCFVYPSTLSFCLVLFVYCWFFFYAHVYIFFAVMSIKKESTTHEHQRNTQIMYNKILTNESNKNLNNSGKNIKTHAYRVDLYQKVLLANSLDQSLRIMTGTDQ